MVYIGKYSCIKGSFLGQIIKLISCGKESAQSLSKKGAPYLFWNSGIPIRNSSVEKYIQFQKLLID